MLIQGEKYGSLLHIQPPKRLHTFSSVWRKTNLDIGNVGGAGANSYTSKNGDINSYVLDTIYANFQQFLRKWSFRRYSQTKTYTFCAAIFNGSVILSGTI